MAARRPPKPTAENGTSFYILLTSVILLSITGLVAVFSASHVTALANEGDSFFYLKAQAVWLALGFFLMFIFSKADFRLSRRFSMVIAIFTCVALAFVLVPGIGKTVEGASRWMAIGGQQFQPSEIAKFALVILAADYLARKRGVMDDWKEMAFPVLPIFLVMALLILKQPDLGAVIILFGILLVTLWVGGIKPLHMLSLLVVTVSGMAISIATNPYQQTRLQSYFNSGADASGSGYQIIQSYIALGSGNFFGVGLGMSKQKFFYLPAAHTDFVFSIIGEEGGLLATMVVVALFCLVAYAGVRIAIKATTYFDRLVASGITAMIIVQAMLNMGAVTGILPVTGEPLPLISYGGTSLVITLIGVGILLNIAGRERKANEGIIDARDYFGGRNRRPPVSRARSGRNAG